jgi:hypothetical protein
MNPGDPNQAFKEAHILVFRQHGKGQNKGECFRTEK